MHSRHSPEGFTLLEVLVAMAILTVALGALAAPLAAHVQLRRHEETRRLLDEAREALLGFAAAHGRLPCPAVATSRGDEAFAPGGDAANGRCAAFHDAFLPAATLGLWPLDRDGFARDAWSGESGRIRYAVYGTPAINGVEHPFTRTGGLRAVSLPSLAAAPHYLYICASAPPGGASGCGPAANQLTRRAAFVLLSRGPNGHETPGAGSDEARNLDGDAVFVSREVSAQAGNPFDDLVHWTAVPLLTSRLVASGRLP